MTTDITTDPTSCHLDDSLDVAAKLMWEHGLGALPVVDDEGHMLGTLTDRDIAMAAYRRHSALIHISVRDTLDASKPEAPLRASANSGVRDITPARLRVVEARARTG